MADRTPAQLYALVIGAALAIAGIAGFFYSSAFGSPGRVDDAFGVLSVNGWHDALHVATGALGLVCFSRMGARRYALAVAVAYTAVAIWGLALGSGGSILGIVPVNAEDDALHLLIALLGLTAYALSGDRTAHTAA